MFLRRFAVIGFFALSSFSANAPALADQATLSVMCELSADKSRVETVATNPDSNSYSVRIDCIVKPAGGHVFQAYTCNFALPAGATNAKFCPLKGDGPGSFVEARQKYTWLTPR